MGSLFNSCAQPASTEPLNGRATPGEDIDEESSDDVNTPTNSLFPPREGRSASGSHHDRARTTGSISSAIAINSTNPNTASASSGRRSLSKTRQHRNSQTHQRPTPALGTNGGTSGSPPSARETFLNYFFGQNGPGPIAGSSLERSNAAGTSDSGIVPIGRDVSGADSSLSTGLMAGKRGLDGNSAAFDMKSLGKHIEAVSPASRGCYSVLISLTRNRHPWRVRI